MGETGNTWLFGVKSLPRYTGMLCSSPLQDPLDRGDPFPQVQRCLSSVILSAFPSCSVSRTYTGRAPFKFGRVIRRWKFRFIYKPNPLVY
jgi:hypothetical protein